MSNNKNLLCRGCVFYSELPYCANFKSIDKARETGKCAGYEELDPTFLGFCGDPYFGGPKLEYDTLRIKENTICNKCVNCTTLKSGYKICFKIHHPDEKAFFSYEDAIAAQKKGKCRFFEQG